MKGLLLKTLLFSGLLAAALYPFDRLLLDKSKEDVNSYEMLYATANNSLDVLFLGNSHLFRGIDPRVFDARTGLNSRLVFSSGSNIAQVYYDLLESLNSQSPKLVVIETWPIFAPSSGNNNLFVDGNLRNQNFSAPHSKRFGEIKYKEISRAYPGNDKWFHMFNFFRYHERWTNLELMEESLLIETTLTAEEAYYRRYYRTDQMSMALEPRYMRYKFKEDKMYISEDEEYFLKEIISLTQEEGIKLLFLSVPVYDVYFDKVKVGFDRLHKHLNALTAAHDHVDLLDLNYEFGGFSRNLILNERRLHTNQHLNYSGQIRTTGIVVDYIQSKYQIEAGGKNIDKIQIEDYMYGLIGKSSDTRLSGAVTKVNGRRPIDSLNRKYFVVKPADQHIKIEGWMHFDSDGADDLKKKRFALKKDDFVYIQRKLWAAPVPEHIKDRGEQYASAGFYNRRVPKTLFEPGVYELYLVYEEPDEIILNKTEVSLLIE